MDKPQIPRLETPQTAHIRASYPTIEYLEDGYVADWLKERKDQLLEYAREERSGINANKLVSGAVLAAGFFFHALSPLAPVGVVLGIIGYAHGCYIDATHNGSFSPFPFIRGNVLDVAGTLGNADLREKQKLNGEVDEFEVLQHYLPLNERKEYRFIEAHFITLTEYLNQVEPLKRFHAYRWIFDCFLHYQGALPSPEQIQAHMINVVPDVRVDHSHLEALEQRRSFLAARNQPRRIEEMGQITPMPNEQVKFFEVPIPQPLPQNPPAIGNDTKLKAVNVTPVEEPSNPNTPNLQEMLKLPLQQRATAIAACLIESGFKIDEVMNGQVIAVAGTQRGGKGTLAGILTILSKALDPNLNVQYFTAGVDVYPFKCNLNSALQHSARDGDEADKKVASDLLLFLKGLESCEPYSHKNLVLIIDEAMRLLSLVKEEDRVWMIQYLLSRFAKTGGTLIIVLHSNNLGAVVGSKNTSGLADTFKQSISFIGCVAKSVSAGGLRKINVASGEYFKANPENFGSAIADGQLGSIPDWLLTEKHPGNGYPDPVRTLLTFFPELYEEPPIQPKSKDKLSETIQKLEASFNIEVEEPKTESTPNLEDSSSTVIQPTAPELTSHEQQLLSWIVTRKTTGKEYDLNSANKNLEKLIKPDDFDSKAEYLRHLMRQLVSKKKGKLINPNLFEPD
jgi:hypothetical protein